MGCETCNRLQAEFERLERQYAAARGELVSRADRMHAEEYSRLKAFTVDAWVDCEVARVEMGQHLRVHGKAN